MALLVQKAEEIVRASGPDKEYLPITGLPAFTKNALLLAYGPNSQPLKEGAVRYFNDSFVFKDPFLKMSTRLALLNLSPGQAPCVSERHLLRVITRTQKLSMYPSRLGEITYPFSRILG